MGGGITYSVFKSCLVVKRNCKQVISLDCDAMRIRSRIGGPDSCKVRPNSKPWMVRLVRYVENGMTTTWKHICGGTLISEHHVLTADHCLTLFPRLTLKNETKVVVGDHIISEN